MEKFKAAEKEILENMIQDIKEVQDSEKVNDIFTFEVDQKQYFRISKEEIKATLQESKTSDQESIPYLIELAPLKWEKKGKRGRKKKE